MRACGIKGFVMLL